MLRDTNELCGLLIAQNVGPQYGLDTNTVGQPDQYPITPYNTVDASLGYLSPIMKKLRLRLDVQVNNVFNDHGIISLTALSTRTLGSLRYTLSTPAAACSSASQ